MNLEAILLHLRSLFHLEASTKEKKEVPYVDHLTMRGPIEGHHSYGSANEFVDILKPIIQDLGIRIVNVGINPEEFAEGICYGLGGEIIDSDYSKNHECQIVNFHHPYLPSLDLELIFEDEQPSLSDLRRQFPNNKYKFDGLSQIDVKVDWTEKDKDPLQKGHIREYVAEFARSGSLYLAKGPSKEVIQEINSYYPDSSVDKGQRRIID